MTDHFQLAEEFFERSEFEKACEEYEQAVVLQSDHVEAYIGWGRALNELAKHEEVIAKYKEAIAKYQQAIGVILQTFIIWDLSKR